MTIPFPIHRLKSLWPFLIFLYFSFSVFSQSDHTRVFVIGNTADIPAGSPFFSAFRQMMEESKHPIQLILTGDVVKGCQDGNPNAENLKDLFAMVAGLSQVEVTVLPGDRDWDRSGPNGYDCARELEKIIEKEGPDNMHWPIDRACPGPEIKDLTQDIILIALNTQWWNHPHRKPTPADASCDVASPGVILEEINDAIEENLDKYILVAGHFPPFSLGEYGGRFPLSAHLFPPLIGSFRVAYHQNIGSSMDLNNEHFSFFSGELRKMAIEYEGLVFLSGHDHNQQILNYRGNYLINSGAPVKGTYSMPTNRASLSSKKAGFLELTYGKKGEVMYIFHHWNGTGFNTEKEGQIYQSPCQIALDTSIMLSPTIHCEGDSNLTKSDLEFLDTPIPLSTKVMAGAQYKAGFLRRLFFGPHYRDTWTTPVEVSYLNLDKTLGGLEPKKRGGGRQTISLKMRAADGRNFVFRSVDKDPSGAFPITLRNTIITDVTRDQTSTQHPYGALVVAPLLEKLNILHASPKLYVMPSDPKLGPFQTVFGGMLGMLEERPSDPKKGVPAFGGADEILKSYELFSDRLDKPSIRIESKEFALARLFDIWIGDWSKHEDNWKWAAFEEADHKIVRPIPRDRDHAFSNLDGLLPWLADRQWAVPNLENFGYEVKSVRSLTFQARHMDRFLTSELNRQDWIAAAEKLQNNISLKDIEESVMALPVEVQSISGKTIQDKLKRRREDLKVYAEEFYELLANQVDVVGTNERERFEVSRKADGATLVEVFSDETDERLFSRLFLPAETREIRLYGLHGNDAFIVEGNAEKAIGLRIIGGPGKDQIRDHSQVSKGGKTTFIYEKSEQAEIETGTEAKRVDHWNEKLYQYDRTAFSYNGYAPLAYLSFNSFNGLMLGGGVTFTRRNFTKRDFSSKHKLGASISTLSNYTIDYEGRWHEILRNWDLTAGLGYGRPIDYNFFFGLGNETIKDEALFSDDYYRFFINAFQANLGLDYTFLRKSSFSLNFGYEHNKPFESENTILEDQLTLLGNGELSILKAIARLELDLRDHNIFPSRGIRLAAQHETGRSSADNYGVTDLLAEFFLTPHRFPITLGFKGGFSTTSGQVPFYKQPSLGLNEGLRGFQRNRFTGDERIYWNTELRIPLGSVQTPIVPFKIGLRGFYDQGQVRTKDEDSAIWHSGYGGGVYLIPLSRSYSFSIFAAFSEEESGLIGFQLGTNF